MAVIRTYPVGEAQSRPAPDVAFQPMASPAARDIENFAGMNQAKDMMVAGAYLEKASNSLGDIAMREAEKVNEAYVQDLNNQFIKSQQEMLYTGPDAFYRKQGKAALDAAPAATERLQELQKGMLEQTKNEWQKVRLTRILNGHLNEVTNGMSRFVAAQSMEWEKQVLRDRVELVGAETRVRYNDTGFLDNQVAGLTSVFQAEAVKNGHAPDSDSYKVAGLKARSFVYGNAIDQALNNNDTAYAIQLFDKHKDKLDGPTQDRLSKNIETARMGVSATSEAEALMNPTYDGRTKFHESGKMEFNKLGSGAFGPFQFMPGTWADVRSKHPELNLPADMTAATYEQHALAHKAFKTDNAGEIQKAGFPVTAANLYLAQRFGASGATAVLRANPDTPLSNILPANWFDKNPDLKGQTAGSFRSLAERRYAGVTDLGIDTGAPPPAPGIKGDPLVEGVNRATGVQPPQNGSAYKDPRQLMLEVDATRDAATAANNEANAGNDQKRRAVQADIDRITGQRKQQIETERLRLETDLNNWMVAGQSGIGATQRPPPDIWNRLSYQQQQAVDATIAHNAAGTEAKTNQQVWYNVVKGLSSEDPLERNKWANAPLWELKPYLSNQDFQELAKMQATVRKGDPEKQMTHVRGINQMTDDALLKMAIDPTPKPRSGEDSDAWKAAKFRRAVQDQVTALERDQGKKATPEQQQKIIDSMVIEVITKPGMLWDDTKRRYEMTIKDVPEAEKAKIIDSLKRNGKPVNDEAIIDLFARKNAKAPK